MNLKLAGVLLLTLATCLTGEKISPEVLSEIVLDAERDLQPIMEEKALAREMVRSIPGHGRRAGNNFTQAMEARNVFMRLITEKLAKKLNLDKYEAAHQLRLWRQANSGVIPDQCTDTAITCSSSDGQSRFRSINGRCNNIKNPYWGSMGVPQRRILSDCKRDFFNTLDNLQGGPGKGNPGGGNPGKGNPGGGNPGKGNPGGKGHGKKRNLLSVTNSRGASCPPVSTIARGFCPNTKKPLPNVRLVSSTFHKDQDVPSKRLTQLFTIFGQFVDHDFAETATYMQADCCTNSDNREECAPIRVAQDPFFETGHCLNFVRSLVFCEELGCTTDPASAITSFVDSSNVYGSEDEKAHLLRENTQGRMKISSGELLPIINGNFMAGDVRSLEHPGLGTIHTLFLREHNRIAGKISAAYPSMSDEEIYQSARRIVNAEYQNIVFGEFLPLVIGSNSVFPTGTTSTTYDPNVDASMIIEFTSASFRFGHTLINGKFERRDPYNGSLLDFYLLRFNFENAAMYKVSPDYGMLSIIKGMSAQRAQSFDQFVSEDLTNFLFAKESDDFKFGEDLVSRNIQRGRDHSLQPWTSYRQFCGLSSPNNWNQRPSDISAEKWRSLSTLYRDVDDIDLFVGGLAEDVVNGGTVGSTFACINKLMFSKLLKGDRYFFTHGGDVGARFTMSQIAALRKIKMSDIICKNSHIQSIPRNAFEVVASNGNYMIECWSATDLDISIFF